MRIILFTGKGGVGKTTTAAATAIQTAKKGYKTLLISTDPAHSLSDSLSMELSPEPMQVSENLWCMEFDVYYSMKKYWGNMREMMRSIFRFKGMEDAIAEELSVLPGMEEGAAFLWLEKFYREKAYDVIVIDSAPTGETLSLLSLPQVAQAWLTKAFPGQKFAVKTFGKVLRKTTGIPLDKGYEELDLLFDKLAVIQKIFLDPKITSIRIVANPEHMVIQEAKRAYSYLQLYGYNVDAVVVNRILPDTKNDFFKSYLENQVKYLQDIEESFFPLPIFKVQHQGEEVFGVEKLNKIGESIYQGKDPAEVYHLEQPMEIEKIASGYRIKLKIPFLKEEKFTLKKHGDELIIQLNNQRKNLFLPKFANFMKLGDFKYHAPWLEVELMEEG